MTRSSTSSDGLHTFQGCRKGAVPLGHPPTEKPPQSTVKSSIRCALLIDWFAAKQGRGELPLQAGLLMCHALGLHQTPPHLICELLWGDGGVGPLPIHVALLQDVGHGVVGHVDSAV